MAKSIYPPPPVGVPANLTRSSAAFRMQTLLVLLSLLLFLLFYIALITAVGWLIYWMATNIPSPPATSGGRSGRGVGLMYIAWFGGIIALGLLILFLIKGLFKSQGEDSSNYWELQEEKQPELFAFIRRVCQEASAPFPSGVFVSPEVNAAVFYKSSLLNLVFPPRKKLLIGAGLVHSVDLREFQAVLAHEFGHFSQKSLAVGNYVYVANRVIADMVYARDKWDDALDAWCAFDIRVSFPAWGLKGVVFVLRAILGGAFQGINRLQMALSRQMEFNADDVAVSVAGSDAIVTTLCKIEFADRCFATAIEELKAAADHGLLSSDVFHHLRDAATLIRQKEKNPKLGIPPEPPARVFEPDDHSTGPAMWASHPPNHAREDNAKRFDVRAEPDRRSPWILFSDPERIRRFLSQRLYALLLDRPKVMSDDLTDPLEVAAFIQAERAETTFDPRYHGLFDDRFLTIKDLDAALTTKIADPATLAEQLNSFPPPETEEVMSAHRRCREELVMLVGQANAPRGERKSTIEFRGTVVPASEVERLLKKVTREFEADGEQFKEWDQQMYDRYITAAQALDPARADDLRRRYRFVLSVQNWSSSLNEHFGRVVNALSALSGERKLEESEFRELMSILTKAADNLEECHQAARKLTCPAMTNVAEETKLSDLIGSKDFKAARFAMESIDGNQIQKLMTGYQSTLERLQRLSVKGLGSLLAKQEAIAKDFQASILA